MSLVDNKKAGFNYEITDKYDAGIELLGFEVKSIKAGRGKLDGAHVKIRGGEAFLVGADIPPYQANNTPILYDSERTRKLLLTKKELLELAEVENKQGLTLIPLALYNEGNKVKLVFGVAKHKKVYDKRETIRKKDLTRDMERTLK